MKPASLFLWFVIGFSLSLFFIVHRAYPHSGGLDGLTPPLENGPLKPTGDQQR